MAKFTFLVFEFKRPPRLNFQEYNYLKTKLMENPRYNINPSVSFFGTFKFYFYCILIGAFGVLLEMINLTEWLNFISVLLVGIGMISLASFVFSIFSYLMFLGDKSDYYSAIKEDIIKSKNYSEFVDISY